MKNPLWITAFDENFRPMFERQFLPAFTKFGLDKKYELEVHELGDVYGSYGEPRYNQSYRDELKRVIARIEANTDRGIIWSDVDIRLYRDPTEYIQQTMHGADLSCIMDRMPTVPPTLPPVVCTGFQYFWPSYKVIQFMKRWEQLDIEPGKNWQSPQDSFNEALVECRMNVRHLDKRFWTVGLSGEKAIWDGADVVTLPNPPDDIILHHGNYTIGLDNKLRLMDEIARRVK